MNNEQLNKEMIEKAIAQINSKIIYLERMRKYGNYDELIEALKMAREALDENWRLDGQFKSLTETIDFIQKHYPEIYTKATKCVYCKTDVATSKEDCIEMKYCIEYMTKQEKSQ